MTAEESEISLPRLSQTPPVTVEQELTYDDEAAPLTLHSDDFYKMLYDAPDSTPENTIPPPLQDAGSRGQREAEEEEQKEQGFCSGCGKQGFLLTRSGRSAVHRTALPALTKGGPRRAKYCGKYRRNVLNISNPSGINWSEGNLTDIQGQTVRSGETGNIQSVSGKTVYAVAAEERPLRDKFCGDFSLLLATSAEGYAMPQVQRGIFDPLADGAALGRGKELGDYEEEAGPAQPSRMASGQTSQADEGCTGLDRAAEPTYLETPQARHLYGGTNVAKVVNDPAGNQVATDRSEF